MRHNLETIKLKIRAYNTDRGSLQDVWDEWAAFENELRERLEADIEQLKEIPSSVRTKYAIDFIKEILG